MFIINEFYGEYDYGTGDVVGDNIFDTSTTGCAWGRRMINNPEYERRKNNVDAKIVQMCPAEYFQECAYNIFNVPVSQLKHQRGIQDKDKIDALKSVIVDKKKQFPICYIDYTTKCQEGLHRMYAAGELFGWDKEFPVLVVDWYDKDLHNYHIKQAEDYKIVLKIKEALRKAFRFEYEDYAEFEEYVSELINIALIDKECTIIFDEDSDSVIVNVEDVTVTDDFKKIKVM